MKTFAKVPCSALLPGLFMLWLVLIPGCSIEDPNAFIREPPLGMVRIPSGSFMMGCVLGDVYCDVCEKPSHRVTVDPFFMDIYEVTVAEYRLCVEAGSCSKEHFDTKDENSYCNWGYPDRDNHPINCMSWNGAVQYAQWAGKRLPTEAEWEYAARGGLEEKLYPWGDAPLTCNHAVAERCDVDCKVHHTYPVGSKPMGKNGFGLYDMAGNVFEWCSDWYSQNYYTNSPKQNPTGPPSGTFRVNRGGGFNGDACGLRTSLRCFPVPGCRYFTYGFRCAKDQ